MKRVAVLLLAGALSACGAAKHRLTLEPGLSSDERMRIEVGQVTNDSGKTFDVPVEQMLQDALTKELAGKDLLWSDPSAARHLILQGQIVDYEPGDAFKRWLMPGYGTTVLSVRGNFLDTTNGVLVGSFETRRTVSVGGAYSIGAWRTIFKSVAEDIVDDLQKQLKAPKEPHT